MGSQYAADRRARAAKKKDRFTRSFPATRSNARSAHGGRVPPLYPMSEAVAEGARGIAIGPPARLPLPLARLRRPTTVRRRVRSVRESARERRGPFPCGGSRERASDRLGQVH